MKLRLNENGLNHQRINRYPECQNLMNQPEAPENKSISRVSKWPKFKKKNINQCMISFTQHLHDPFHSTPSWSLSLNAFNIIHDTAQLIPLNTILDLFCVFSYHLHHVSFLVVLIGLFADQASPIRQDCAFLCLGFGHALFYVVQALSKLSRYSLELAFNFCPE